VVVSKRIEGATTSDDQDDGGIQVLARAEIRHDRDLATRHMYGDPEAFDEVYERFSGMVFQIARRMAGDPALAEDLSQEIFLRIFKYLPKFKGKSSLKTWVYRVSLNCCRSRLGRRSRRGRAFVEIEDERFDQMPTPAEGTDARVKRREASEVVGQALAQLPIKFREAVVLRDISGLAYDEIAVVLDVRLGTVRSRIARGREGLRRILTEEGTK